MAFLGLLPHALFSRWVGTWTYFKSAYDEDTYALWLLTGGGPRVPGRGLANALMTLLFRACGGSWNFSYIIADVVFPVLAVIGAWFLAGRFTRVPVVRALCCFLLLFAHELLSFEGSTVLSHGTWDVRARLSALVPWAGAAIPDVYDSYFLLFRTPEPQVSLGFFFAFLALFISFLTSEPGPRKRLLGAFLLLANAALAVLYLFLATSLVLVQIVCSVLLAAGGKRREAGQIFFCGALGLISVVLGAFAVGAGRGMQGSGAFLFPSRMPILTVASVGSAILLAILFFRSGRRVLREERLSLAAASFATSLLLTNQQILTGWMMETREWERYSNYPLLVIGIFLWASVVGGLWTHSARVVAGVLLVIACVLTLRGQRRVFSFFHGPNEATLAMKTALVQIPGASAAGIRLVLEEPDLAPLLEFRMNRRLPCVIDFTDTPRRILPMSVENGNWGLRSPFKRNLFEQFARTGRSSGQVQAILSSEADQRAGFLLSFLFSLMDHWYPVTDDRRVRQREIRALIPAIVRDYELYLTLDQPEWHEPAIRLTKNLAPETAWGEQLLARGSAGRGSGSITIYAFLQTGHAARGGGAVAQAASR